LRYFLCQPLGVRNKVEESFPLSSVEYALSDLSNVARAGCPFRKLYPAILVMKSAQNFGGNDASSTLDRPAIGRVFAKAEMGPRRIVIK
jgi:hypothetical protein